MLVGASLNGGNLLEAAAAALAPRVRELLLQSPAGGGGREGAAEKEGKAGLDDVFAFLEFLAEEAAADERGSGIRPGDEAALGALESLPPPAALLLPERAPVGWPPEHAAEGARPAPPTAAPLPSVESAAAALRTAAATASRCALGRWYLRCVDCVIACALDRLPRAAWRGGGLRIDAVVASGGVFARSSLSKARLEAAVAELGGEGAPRILWLPPDVAAYAGAVGAALCCGASQRPES